jgi:hypothetical protein
MCVTCTDAVFGLMNKGGHDLRVGAARRKQPEHLELPFRKPVWEVVARRRLGLGGSEIDPCPTCQRGNSLVQWHELGRERGRKHQDLLRDFGKQSRLADARIADRRAVRSVDLPPSTSASRCRSSERPTRGADHATSPDCAVRNTPVKAGPPARAGSGGPAGPGEPAGTETVNPADRRRHNADSSAEQRCWRPAR